MQIHLNNYIQNPKDSFINYTLANDYYEKKLFASALSFYLRAAELEDKDTDFIYTCLLMCFHCFDKQKDRKDTAITFLKHALYIDSDRPEAYYLLSKIYGWLGNYQDSYTYANLGLKTFKNTSLIRDVEYPGYFSLKYQKVLAGYSWGKPNEARKIIQDLYTNHWNEMPKDFKDLIWNNLFTLNDGNKTDNLTYDKEYFNLNFSFRGLEKIKNNYSQIYQDIFVLAALDGKENGFFLELGGAEPFYRNNTYLLEKDFFWKGISVDYNSETILKYRLLRPNINLIEADARNINYKEILPSVVDYLQLDLDPPEITYEVLLKLPFDTVKFSVITYEHDYYYSKEYKEKSRNFLLSKGYELLVNDVSMEGVNSFEDWWVHPDLVTKERRELLKYVELNKVTNIQEYMLEKSQKVFRRPWRS